MGSSSSTGCIFIYWNSPLYMYITKYSCVFLKLGESIYVAMDLIPILLGSLPLTHNAQQYIRIISPRRASSLNLFTQSNGSFQLASVPGLPCSRDDFAGARGGA